MLVRQLRLLLIPEKPFIFMLLRKVSFTGCTITTFSFYFVIVHPVKFILEILLSNKW